jgi:hypothetical protein
MKTRKYPPPPNLEELILAWNGWDRVPESAWKEYGAAVEEWKAKVRNGEVIEETEKGPPF